MRLFWRVFLAGGAAGFTGLLIAYNSTGGPMYTPEIAGTADYPTVERAWRLLLRHRVGTDLLHRDLAARRQHQTPQAPGLGTGAGTARHR